MKVSKSSYESSYSITSMICSSVSILKVEDYLSGLEELSRGSYSW